MTQFPATNSASVLASVCSEPLAGALARVCKPTLPAARIGLSPLDTRAALAFVAGNPEPLLQEIRAMAESLVGSEASAGRRRLLARSIAMLRTQIDVLQALQGQRFLAQDLKATEVLDRMLDKATRRLAVLVQEHRAEGSPRPVVQVAVQTANILAGSLR